MSRTRLTSPCRTSRWAIQLTLSIIIPAVFCQSVAAQAKGHVVNKVVNSWITVSQKQYERHLYTHAEESLVRAGQYEQYLNTEQKHRIDTLLERIRSAMSEKKRVLEYVDRADELIEQGQYLKAKAYLEQAKKSKRLNEAQIKRVKVTLERVDAKIDEQKRLMADLYKRSRKHYKQGNIEKAREGFAIVASSGLYVPRMGKTAEQYLAMIEQRPVQAQKPAKLQIPWPKPEKPLVLPAVPTEQYGNEPMRGSLIRENVKHSYLKAVIRDAETRANMHVGKAEFSIAKAVVQNAEKVLQQYRPDIEPHLYDQHNERLQKLTRMVNEQQRRWELRWDTKDSGL